MSMCVRVSRYPGALGFDLRQVCAMLQLEHWCRVSQVFRPLAFRYVCVSKPFGFGALVPFGFEATW